MDKRNSCKTSIIIISHNHCVIYCEMFQTLFWNVECLHFYWLLGILEFMAKYRWRITKILLVIGFEIIQLVFDFFILLLMSGNVDTVLKRFSRNAVFVFPTGRCFSYLSTSTVPLWFALGITESWNFIYTTQKYNFYNIQKSFHISINMLITDLFSFRK